MNMQQMLAQAQKIQRQMEKAQAELDKKEFVVSKNGAVTVKALGSGKITAIEIDDSLLTAEDKDMLQDMILMAINEILEKINEESEAIKASATGGFSF